MTWNYIQKDSSSSPEKVIFKGVEDYNVPAMDSYCVDNYSDGSAWVFRSDADGNIVGVVTPPRPVVDLFAESIGVQQSSTAPVVTGGGPVTLTSSGSLPTSGATAPTGGIVAATNRQQAGGLTSSVGFWVGAAALAAVAYVVFK